MNIFKVGDKVKTSRPDLPREIYTVTEYADHFIRLSEVNDPRWWYSTTLISPEPNVKTSVKFSIGDTVRYVGGIGCREKSDVKNYIGTVSDVTETGNYIKIKNDPYYHLSKYFELAEKSTTSLEIPTIESSGKDPYGNEYGKPWPIIKERKIKWCIDWMQEEQEKIEHTAEYLTTGPAIEITEQLCTRMQELGLSYKELAIRTGKTKKQIHKFFGSFNPKLDDVCLIADAMGMRPIITMYSIEKEEEEKEKDDE